MVAIQFTTSAKEWGFYDLVQQQVRNFKVGDKKCTPTAQKLFGHISSVAPKKEDNQKICYFSWREMNKSFNVSNRGIQRSLKALKENGVINSVNRKACGIGYSSAIKREKGALYDVIPRYLYTAQIKDGKGMRSINASEVTVAGHIMTLAMPRRLLRELLAGKDKHGKKLTYNQIAKKIRDTHFQCEISVKQCAKTLNLSETTIYKALKVFDKAGIFWVTYGKNRHKPNCKITIANKNLYSYLLYIRPKKQKHAQEVEDANARAEHSRYYSKLREKAQNRADSARQKANANPRYKQVSKELKILEKPLAEAELYEPDKLPALKERQTALSREGQAILATMGLKESDLFIQHYCKKCQDTGFVRNGAACDCYRKYQIE